MRRYGFGMFSNQKQFAAFLVVVFCVVGGAGIGIYTIVKGMQESGKPAIVSSVSINVFQCLEDNDENGIWTYVESEWMGWIPAMIYANAETNKKKEIPEFNWSSTSDKITFELLYPHKKHFDDSEVYVYIDNTTAGSATITVECGGQTASIEIVWAAKTN